MGAGLLALEVGPDDAPETPSGPGLLHYAQKLGKAADRLAKLDTLPTAATVLAELGTIAPPSPVVEWDERRIVEIAAAASRRAAATPRLEIYPRDLPLVRALRLTQAGLVPRIPGMPDEQQPGLTAKDIHERVRARFPELLNERRGHALPTDGPLTRALREAGFDLELKTREGHGTLRYIPRQRDGQSTYLSSDAARQATGVLTAHRYSDDPQLAGAAVAEERLLASARRDGFRVLTVRTGLASRAVGELTSDRFGAEAVSVTDLFVRALHEQVDPRPKPTWETILRADAAEPGSKAAMRFGEYARTSWGAVEPRLRELVSGVRGPSGSGSPVLLTDAGAFARYDAMAVLERLADAARDDGRGLWLLCPQSDPARPPRLGAVAVPYQSGLGEWIRVARIVGGQRPPGGGVGGTCGLAGGRLVAGRLAAGAGAAGAIGTLGTTGNTGKCDDVIDASSAAGGPMIKQVKAIEVDLAKQVKDGESVLKPLRQEFEKASKADPATPRWSAWLDGRLGSGSGSGSGSARR
ncbi:hypothetical protein SANTM175S_08909 [Streptomyces antimycoticus]